ncbi:MAG: PAS domain-containing protein [Kordiimonadaceae bacterium]|nr:PAS domain-containing protein [Kordiimonadaceae bacterium]
MKGTLNILPTRENGQTVQRANFKFRDTIFHSTDDIRKNERDFDTILSYFEQKTEGKRIAKRADLVPSELTIWLPNICILEPLYTGDPAEGVLENIQINLIGTALAAFYGETTGKLVTDSADSEAFKRLMQVAQNTIDGKKPVIASWQSDLTPSRAYLRLQALHIPMSDDGASINRFFVYMCVTRHKKASCAI